MLEKVFVFIKKDLLKEAKMGKLVSSLENMPSQFWHCSSSD